MEPIESLHEIFTLRNKMHTVREHIKCALYTVIALRDRSLPGIPEVDALLRKLEHEHDTLLAEERLLERIYKEASRDGK